MRISGDLVGELWTKGFAVECRKIVDDKCWVGSKWIDIFRNSQWKRKRRPGGLEMIRLMFEVYVERVWSLRIRVEGKSWKFFVNSTFFSEILQILCIRCCLNFFIEFSVSSDSQYFFQNLFKNTICLEKFSKNLIFRNFQLEWTELTYFMFQVLPKFFLSNFRLSVVFKIFI